MKKQILLYTLLLFLIICNGFFIFHFFKKTEQHKPAPRLFIVEELNFSDEQMASYNTITNLHFETLDGLLKNIRKSKKALFSKIAEDTIPQHYIDSIATKISYYEKQKELEIFNHLLKVKKICNKKQEKKFLYIMKDALNQHNKRGRQPHKPPNRMPPKH